MDSDKGERSPSYVIPCEDFGAFQAVLKIKREIDDKIVYMLNTSIPTSSFAGQVDPKEKCKDLHDQIRASYDERNTAIQNCLETVRKSVSNLQSEKSQSPSNADVNRRLRTEQTKLRLMQSELNVEEVLKDRILRVFNDRCKFHYTIERLT